MLEVGSACEHLDSIDYFIEYDVVVTCQNKVKIFD